MKNMEDLSIKRQKLIKLLKVDKIKEKDCEI